MKQFLVIFLSINILLAAFNVWVLKDNRHVSMNILGEGCVNTVMPQATADYVNANLMEK